jgi:tetratricopeptide (TPR) repeat protein
LRNIQKGEMLGLGANRQFESVVRQHAALILIRSSFFDLALAQLEPLSKYEDNSPAVIEAAGLCALTLPRWPSELSSQKLAVVDLAGKALWAGTSRRSKEAVAAYRDLLTTYPREPGVHYAHGLYLLESDQDAALTEFEQEIRANPAHWPSLLVFAALENKRGDAERASEAARTAAQSVPASYLWLCHAEMGRAYLSMRSATKAVTEFEVAVKQAPDNPQMHFCLEQSYRLAGNMEAARKEKAEFIRLKTLQDPATVASQDAN